MSRRDTGDPMTRDAEVGEGETAPGTARDAGDAEMKLSPHKNHSGFSASVASGVGPYRPWGNEVLIEGGRSSEWRRLRSGTILRMTRGLATSDDLGNREGLP